MFGAAAHTILKTYGFKTYSEEVRELHLHYFTNVDMDCLVYYVIYPDTMSSEEVNKIDGILYPMYETIIKLSNHRVYAHLYDADRYKTYDRYQSLCQQKCERLIHEYHCSTEKGKLCQFKESYGTDSLNDLLAGVMTGYGEMLKDELNKIEK